MAAIDTLRNDLIDKLLNISDKEYLVALNHLVEKCSTNNDLVNLTEEQITMLQLSDNDILMDRTIGQEQLNKEDLKWLKGK